MNVAVIRLPVSTLEVVVMHKLRHLFHCVLLFLLCTINFFWGSFGQSPYQNYTELAKLLFGLSPLRKTRLTGKTLFNVPSVWEENLLSNSYNKKHISDSRDQPTH